MKYQAPNDGLPAYVNGSRQPGEPYVLQTNVLVFAPLGGGVVDGALRDGASIGIGRGEDKGREVGTTTVRMIPGAVTELVFSLVAPAGPSGAEPVAPELELTPGVSP